MSLFDQYSQRARRVIFWSLHYAQRAGSGYIEPEHILEGLLKEDPQLFRLMVPEKPNLGENLRNELQTLKKAEASHLKKDLPLSPPSKEIVATAGIEQARLGHQIVATQHLLLALLTACKKKSFWIQKPAELPVQQLLGKHGITRDLVEAKIKDGIITPATWVLDDQVVALNAQIAAIAEILIRKGIFTRSEFVSLLDRNEGPLPSEVFLLPLIEALGEKSILTSKEQHQIKTMASDATGNKVPS